MNKEPIDARWYQREREEWFLAVVLAFFTHHTTLAKLDAKRGALILRKYFQRVAECILTIAKYQLSDAQVVDKEINAMAMLIELLGVIK